MTTRHDSAADRGRCGRHPALHPRVTGQAERRPTRRSRRTVRWTALAVLVTVLAALPAVVAAPHRAIAATGAPAAPALARTTGCMRDTAADFRWVASLYATFLHRSGSFTEVGAWMRAFTDGVPYQAIAYDIADSPEAVSPLIVSLYQQLLHRTPSGAEVASWSTFTRRHSTTRLAAELAGSAEAYADAGGTPGGWLRRTYDDVFGRPADAGGLTYWTGQLAAGVTRTTIARTLWDAAEHLATRVDAAYELVLGRHADPGGARYWATAARTFGDTALGSLLASTQEAWNRAQLRYGGTAGPLPAVCPPPPLAALRGATIAIDPGHDGGNGAHPEIINQPVNYGNGTKACDTAGTETNDGYPEHAFTWDVAQRLAAVLRAAGAQVVLTRNSDTGVGPCITQRAAIGNAAHADAAVSIHADGGPAGGVGFHVIWPADLPGRTTAIVAPSYRLAVALRDAYYDVTGEPTANYLASNGLDQRGDLGGLDLSTVPKVFIECLNLRNAGDAARAEDPAFRQRAAEGIAQGLADYLAARS